MTIYENDPGFEKDGIQRAFEDFEVVGPDLRNILRQSYDNAKVTINLRRTSNLQNI